MIFVVVISNNESLVCRWYKFIKARDSLYICKLLYFILTDITVCSICFYTRELKEIYIYNSILK